MNASIVLPV